MQSSVLVGFVLGALLVAGWYFVPVTLDDAGRVNAIAADKQAELARRELERYSAIATNADQHVEAKQMLEDGDFEKWSKLREQALAKYNEEYKDVENPPPPPPTASPEAMRRGVQDFDTQQVANNVYLESAITNAGEAAKLVSDQPRAHIGLIEGSAALTQAYVKLSEAERARVAVEETLNEVFKYALRQRYQSDKQAYYSAFDTGPIIEDLESGEFGKAELEAQLAAVEAQLGAVSEALAAREAELAKIKDQLTQAQQERLRLESTRADGAMGFSAFRSAYSGVMQRLADLQEKEQLLTNGGLRGAKIDVTDLVKGPITGGERARGTLELSNEKARLAAVHERLVGAIAEIDSQMQQVEESAKLNAETADTYSLRAGKFKEAMIASQGKLAEQTREAFDQETKALDSARAARNAFAQADRAITDFKRKAREVQSSSDPERQNARLKAIIGDQLVEQIGKSAEAAARVLEARILLLRMESVERQRQILQKIVRLTGGELTDERTLTDLVAASRKEGLDTLNAAIDIYADLAGDEGPTAWANLAGQGAAIYLKSRFDSVQGPDLAYEAARIMNKAIAGRQQSPYLAKHVLFYDYLAERTNFSPGGGDSGTGTDPNAASPPTDPNSTAQPETPAENTGDNATEDDPFGS